MWKATGFSWIYTISKEVSLDAGKRWNRAAGAGSGYE